MNPCSLESLSLSNSGLWSVIVSCYQLEKPENRRRGHMDLFLVTRDLKFGNLHTSMPTDSGILDGKWKQSSPLKSQSQQQHWFATARSTGQVRIDSLTFSDEQEKPTVEHVATSEPLLQESNNNTPALCLSLNWNIENDDDSTSQSQIVSSYSNGKVAIHDVVQNEDTVQLVEKESWVAHSLAFGGHTTPTEVWSACFAAFSNNNMVVLSGGDDMKLKLWDVRSLVTTDNKPMQVLQHFEAGVTCISTNPTRTYICVVGSYDETIALYDVRKACTPLVHSEPLGGGIWRIKWHPHNHNRLLVAAMHGGCLIGEFQESKFTVTKEFTKHESMVYGADWLVSCCANDEDLVEGAASCSFYDRAVYLWDTKIEKETCID